MISKIFNAVKSIKRKYYTFRVKRVCKSCGNDLTVNNYSYVTPKTSLGDNVNFNGMKIQGTANVVIGDNFHSGIECMIITDSHNYEGEAIPYDDTVISKDVVIEDNAEWELAESHEDLLGGWKLTLKHFHSDRVLRKIDEVNLKGQQQALQKGKDFKPLEISEEGLETIEWLSLDCTTADPKAPWHSDVEIKIDRLGYVTRNGIKTSDFWDATICSEAKPLRLKIRNICGDGTIYIL